MPDHPVDLFAHLRLGQATVAVEHQLFVEIGVLVAEVCDDAQLGKENKFEKRVSDL